MTVQQQDVAAARDATRALTQAVEALRRHFGDSPDLRRLAVDVRRVEEDLDMLAGQSQASVPVAPALEVIPDREYPPEMWADAEDEGMGPR